MAVRAVYWTVWAAGAAWDARAAAKAEGFYPTLSEYILTLLSSLRPMEA